MNYAQLNQEVIESLKEVAGDDPAFLKELADLYVRQYREKGPQIEQFAAAGQLDKVAAHVHMIKSSSGNLGAMNFHGLCADLEQAAMNKDATEVAKLLPDFVKAFGEVTAAIQKISA